jgi:drug/metabolite transporter (DMT)-like permease
MFKNPYFKVVLAALAWSTSGIFIRTLNLEPGVLSFFRMAVPAVILFTMLKVQKKKIIKGSIGILLFGSLLNAVRLFLYYLAYSYTSLGNAVVILYTWPIFMTVLSLIFLKEKITLRTALLLVSAFGGIIIVFLNKEFSFKNRDFIGMTAMLVSSLIYSFSLLIFKMKIKDYSTYEVTFYQNVVGAFVCIPFLFIHSGFTFIQGFFAGFQGFVVGFIAFVLFFSALEKLTSAKASLLSYIEVVAATCIGIFIFRETVTWNLIAGGTIIIGSVILLKKAD